MEFKRIIFIFLLACITHFTVSARHIKGGFMAYTYLGPSADGTKLKYKITLTAYMECGATPEQITDPINFTIFDAATRQMLYNPVVYVKTKYNLQKLQDEQCITGDQRECYYLIVVYELNSIELPISQSGYVVSYQRCCRIENMDNLVVSGDVGNTYTINIPGTTVDVPDANKNSSPVFPVNDTMVVCASSYFSFQFAAKDNDGDSLAYSLCSSYNGGSKDDPAPIPANAPPYAAVPYTTGFSGSSPLGPDVTINPVTGTISGIAPKITRTGEYVINICVSEYRNGNYFAQARKELHIKVKDCSPLATKLDSAYSNCTSLTQSFANKVPTPSGTEYLWTFGDPASGSLDSSNLATPNHTYSSPGTYTAKLFLSTSGGICKDSAITKIKIYPGFNAVINSNDYVCKDRVLAFQDASTILYGNITTRNWNFGDPSSINNTSTLSSPTFTYGNNGNYTVRLIVENSYGCKDTAQKTIVVVETPPIQLYPKDTLICSIDDLKLTAKGNGIVTWSPNYMIDNVNSFTPVVSPDVPTKYYVSISDGQGCSNKDSVFVDVRSFITVRTINDTTICKGDSIKLQTTSEALSYSWSPVTNLEKASDKSPVVYPATTTTYKVVANLGLCQDNDQVTVKVVPYPAKLSTVDTAVCYGIKSIQLNASGGSIYKWSPSTYLSSADIPNPIVSEPLTSTTYIVKINDTLGCTKPVYDTFNVNVIDKVPADAGPRDTAIVKGQILQLQGSGGRDYVWSPSTALSDNLIANPVSTTTNNINYSLKVTSVGGCTGYDTISVKVYNVIPDIYVPSAFTPNADGTNDIFKPILIGIKEFFFFRVYNRWGQLVFSTTTPGKGWDGMLNGKKQEAGAYVWSAKAVDYLGKTLDRKGSVVLIR